MLHYRLKLRYVPGIRDGSGVIIVALGVIGYRLNLGYVPVGLGMVLV